MKSRKIRKFIQQTSLNLKRPPLELGIILSLVDLVPPNLELKDFAIVEKGKLEVAIKEHQTWFTSKLEELDKLDNNENREFAKNYLNEHYIYQIQNIEAEVAYQSLKECLEGLPSQALKYIKELGEFHLAGEDTYFEALDRYTFIRESRIKLRAIVQHTQYLHSSWEKKLRLPKLETQGTMKINKDGTISIENDPFAEAVEGVDATRIRECPKCRRLFWAGRNTQLGCSTQCSTALRNRNLRKRNKEKHANQVQGESKQNLSRDIDKLTSEANKDETL